MKETADPFLEELLIDVKRIAKLAGEAVMHYYVNTPDHPEFLQYKSDESPVTEADSTSDTIIQGELSSLKEKYPILSEESPILTYNKRKKFRRIWIVDPLDGTKEFINKNDEFTIHIGLSDFGKPVLGVVYAPALELMYFAHRKGGAFMEDRDGKVMPLKVKEVNLKNPGVKVLHSRSYMNKQTEVYINTLDSPICTPMGSSLKIMRIAEGHYDIYPKMGSKMQEWDTCAPQIILEEAGGMMVTTEKGVALEYNKEDLTQPDFYALGKLIAYYDY
jgi:3'(2'), 5'-bisphosphate nucleotidase